MPTPLSFLSRLARNLYFLQLTTSQEVHNWSSTLLLTALCWPLVRQEEQGDILAGTHKRSRRGEGRHCFTPVRHMAEGAYLKGGTPGASDSATTGHTTPHTPPHSITYTQLLGWGVHTPPSRDCPLTDQHTTPTQRCKCYRQGCGKDG
ncbi:hypothetical protein DPMN_111078 [Dreissena polymorpha]|uniref:Uncharacterized protein n=1 Tax=Dreissena polymorpha TaxID=45954 RepID=A0A9D4QPF5_DREPO|nr:hypothetical protein DPMN_111078 [Dreissena polymorpha]